MSSLIETFPIPIFIDFPDDFLLYKEKILDYIYINQSENAGVTKSNLGGWQSQIIKFGPHYDYFNTIIKNCLKNHINRQYKFKINSYWLNVNNPSSQNLFHTHPGSDLSAVLWVEVPENSGDLSFKNPQHHIDYKSLDCFCFSTNYKPVINFTPISGAIIIFPSFLEHSVGVNQSKNNRISIAFNLDLIKNDD
jgi:uncharacterized protein (TIGR02466 family)